MQGCSTLPHVAFYILQDDKAAFNALHPPQQAVTVMPLMHAEDLKQHEVPHCRVVLPGRQCCLADRCRPSVAHHPSWVACRMLI